MFRDQRSHTKVKGHLRSSCRIANLNGAVQLELYVTPNIIHKTLWQVTLAVWGPQCIFSESWYL